MAKKSRARRNALFSAIITFLSFLYKLGLGIYTKTLILIVASISTLLVFICKATFVKVFNGTKEQKKKAYLIMAIAAMSFSVLFILFVVLKVSGIDISKENKYEGWFGLIFIAFTILMFVLSVINLKGALKKTDILLIGLKEMIFISALTDAVIIETFINRIILSFYDLQIIYTLDNYFPLAIGVVMIVISAKMFVRYKNYEE